PGPPTCESLFEGHDEVLKRSWTAVDDQISVDLHSFSILPVGMSVPAVYSSLSESMKLCVALLAAVPLCGQWTQFRGQNASGIAVARNLPIEFGPQKNVLWKTELPRGHSSPVIAGGRIFLTAEEGVTLARASAADKVADTGQG